MVWCKLNVCIKWWLNLCHGFKLLLFFFSFKISVLTQNQKALALLNKDQRANRKLSVCDRDAALTARAVVGKRTVGPVCSVWINQNMEDPIKNVRAACKWKSVASSLDAWNNTEFVSCVKTLGFIFCTDLRFKNHKQYYVSLEMYTRFVCEILSTPDIEKVANYMYFGSSLLLLYLLRQNAFYYLIILRHRYRHAQEWGVALHLFSNRWIVYWLSALMVLLHSTSVYLLFQKDLSDQQMETRWPDLLTDCRVTRQCFYYYDLKLPLGRLESSWWSD